MVRVLIDCCIFSEQRQGGIARYFREILPRIGSRHRDIELFLLWKGTLSPLRGEGITVVPPFFLRPRRLFGGINRFIEKRRFAGSHVFHSTYYTNPPITGMATLVTVYDMIDEHFFDRMSGNGGNFRLHLRRQIATADHVIAISEATRDDVITFIGKRPEDITVCPLAVDNRFCKPVVPSALAEFRRQHRTGDNYILYVGHRFGYKNFGVLLGGWIELRKQSGSAIKLVCVGPGSLLDGHHCDIVIQNGAAQDLVMLADLGDDELRCAYQGARVLCFPSLCEGFGLPILEAAACGLPLVLSNIPAFREVAGDAAIYFNPYDRLDAAAALAKGLSGEVHRELSRKSLVLTERFSWDIAADKHAEVYRRLAATAAAKQ